MQLAPVTSEGFELEEGSDQKSDQEAVAKEEGVHDADALSVSSHLSCIARDLLTLLSFFSP